MRTTRTIRKGHAMPANSTPAQMPRRAAGFRGLASLMAAGAVLSACTQLLPFGSEAERNFVLSYPVSEEAYRAQGTVVFLEDPIMAEGLGGRGITVRLAGGERTIVKGMRWGVVLSEMVRNYFEQSLSRETDATVISEGGLGIRSACRLGLKVWRFELEPGASESDDAVRVSLEAVLVNVGTGDLVGRDLFSKSESPRSNAPEALAAAFDAALAETSGDIAAWLQGNLPACSE